MAENSNVLSLAGAAAARVAVAPRRTDVAPAEMATCGSLRVPEEAMQAATRIRIALTPSDRMIVFTGLDHDDSVGTLTAQMAAAMARIEQSPTLLVDANVRNPTLHASFDVANSPGLTDVLEGRCTIREALRQADTENLSVLTAGTAASLPASMFTGPVCDETFRALRSEYRTIFIHVAPARRFAEAISVLAQCDAVVIAIAAGRRTRAELEELRRYIVALNKRILGVMLTREVPR